MKQRRAKVRGVVKWGLTVVAVMLGLIWAGTHWYQLTFVDGVNQFEILVCDGYIAYGDDYASIGPVKKFFFERAYADTHWRWWFHWERGSFGNLPMRILEVPLWSPCLLTGSLAGIVWTFALRARKRQGDRLCPACGYDLRGLAAGAACPECGRNAAGA